LYPILDLDRFQADFSGAAESADLPFDLRSILYHLESLRDYTEPETAKKMFEIFNRIYLTGEPSRIDDYEVIKKDGSKGVVELSTALMRNHGGEAIGFRGIARDVTERERIRKELKESENKYRTILESIEDGYFEVDKKGNFVFFNESMCKILGYPSQELKGMNNRQFMSEETSKKVFQTFNKVYKTGEPTKVLGWDLIRKDGEKRYVETSISLMRDPKGEPTGFRGIARDITERRRLEKAKERAINHLSHELGTPLSIIQWMIKRFPDELKKGNMERIQEWIERMNRNLIRLRDLQTKIDDILNERPGQERERILNLVEAAISFLDELKDEPLKESAEVIRQKIIKRLDSLHKVEEVQKETIALDAFIRQICQEARLSMRGRPLEIVEKVDKGICIEMDPKVLKKVCEGFLKNAIENTPDEGKIEIELKAEDNLAKIYFHDYGIGITPENQKLIFSGFFHTQDTHHYASKKPYLFNAGGSGSDLLRARVLSERFGFSMDFSSMRCRYLPSDKDECPGSIASCPFIRGKEDCLTSGGSTFSLYLPFKRP
jgi:PAS domain S-box-containing protein